MTTKHKSSAAFRSISVELDFKKISKCMQSGWKLLAFICLLTNSAHAAVFGDFTYVDNGTTVTITDYPDTATGSVAVPETIYDPVTNLQDTVTGIGFEAFRNCTQITSVSIPSGVTIIGNNAFYNCTGLTSVSISPAVSGLSIGTYSFYNCLSLASLNLPVGVTSIGSNAFYLCKGMVSVTLPTSLTSIGNGAFYSCTGLTTVVIPSGITSISPATFYSCSGLNSVTIPSSVTTIGTEAFRYCSGLTSVTLPPNLITLQSRAFASCRALTSIEIPASVTNIGSDVFSICSALTAISVAEENLYYSTLDGVLFNEAQTTLIAYPGGKGGTYTIPAGVVTISSKAFFTNEKLVSVTIPSSVQSILQDAFSTCGLLQSATFLGDAPSMGSGVFNFPASGFVIYFMDGAAGFPTPPDDMIWYGFPLIKLGGSSPTTLWLQSKGLSVDTDIQSDPNGDGVSLLMAWALNLDPSQNLSGSIPKPVIAGNQMSLTFYAGAQGVTYRVETSTDLKNWSDDGVTLSIIDFNQMRTAYAIATGTSFYMRLAVSN